MTLNALFSVPLAVAGAVMTGFAFWGTSAIVMTVESGVALPGGELLSVAVQFTVYDPAALKSGVPVSVRLGFSAGPAELEAARNGAPFV